MGVKGDVKVEGTWMVWAGNRGDGEGGDETAGGAEDAMPGAGKDVNGSV